MPFNFFKKKKEMEEATPLLQVVIDRYDQKSSLPQPNLFIEQNISRLMELLEDRKKQKTHQDKLIYAQKKWQVLKPRLITYATTILALTGATFGFYKYVEDNNYQLELDQLTELMIQTLTKYYQQWNTEPLVGFENELTCADVDDFIPNEKNVTAFDFSQVKASQKRCGHFRDFFFDMFEECKNIYANFCTKEEFLSRLKNSLPDLRTSFTVCGLVSGMSAMYLVGQMFYEIKEYLEDDIVYDYPIALLLTFDERTKWQKFIDENIYNHLAAPIDLEKFYISELKEVFKTFDAYLRSNPLLALKTFFAASKKDNQNLQSPIEFNQPMDKNGFKLDPKPANIHSFFVSVGRDVFPLIASYVLEKTVKTVKLS